MIRNLFYTWFKISKFKNSELQIGFSKPTFWNIFTLNLKLNDEDFPFLISFNIIGDLFCFDFHWSKHRDHAGLTFDIRILGFFIFFNIHDIRHWDHENNDWKELIY